MSGSGLVQAGDVAIIDVSLANSSSNAVNIIPQVVGFSVYESIMSPVVTAELLLYDPLDQLSTLPIVGEETVKLQFATGGYSNTANYTFVTTSLEHQAILPYARGKYYVVRCASEEVLKNLSTQVNKKYATDSSSIVQSIMTGNLGTKKPIIVDQTKGIQEVLLADMRPFQAIDMIRRRCVSAAYESASYCFFENQKGFTLATMEYLADKGRAAIGDKEFSFSTSTSVDFSTPSFRTVIGFRSASAFHNARKIGLGALKNVTRKFDLLTGKVDEITYDDSQGNSFKFASANASGLNSAQFVSKYGQDTSKTLFVPHYTGHQENYAADYAGKKQAFVTRMNENLYHAHLWGDSDMKVGDVITLRIPTAWGTTEQMTDLPLVSGNFLVSKLRHIVEGSVSTERRKYTLAVELIKGFYEGKGLG